MAQSYLFVLCIFMYILTNVQAKYLTGKAFYCRDPDTGKLHAVNSTWPSTTFCGNYTCKLRKKNITETEYTPIRHINITNVDVSKPPEPIDGNDTNYAPMKNTHVEDMSESPSFTIEKRVKPDFQPLLHKEKPISAKYEVELDANNVDNGDRYLTESEIKTISEILHTVKKSDLDAIVDIYNLAQEIYQEMDKTTEKIVSERLIGMKEKKIPAGNKHTSYWYEPLHLGHKYKPTDLEKHGSNTVPAATPIEQREYFHKSDGSDSNKIQNYYPFSNFQRLSSYINPKSTADVQKRPCSKPKDSSRTELEIPKVIQPSIFLPYPFTYIPHYNYTYPGNLLTNGYPLSWNVNNRKAYPPFINAYMTRIPPNVIMLNPHNHLSKEVEIVPSVKEETNIIDKIKDDSKPNWQTDPLPPYVLEEIKANIDKKVKSSPLRKMVNLEKVGKVIKLDEFSRSKRNVGDNADEDMGMDYEGSEYDVFLEKTICQPDYDTRPGFFRVGDITEPYPACCPQRIDSSD